MVNFIKMGAVLAALIFAYFLGLSNGKNNEELKNARLEISTKNAVIAEYEQKQKNNAQSLSNLRIRESASRNELDRMRQQLSAIERVSKTHADNERARCLRLAIKGKELLDRANEAIKFCAENHR